MKTHRVEQLLRKLAEVWGPERLFSANSRTTLQKRLKPRHRGEEVSDREAPQPPPLGDRPPGTAGDG